MGQASIPVLNRTGYFMFWSSSWDDVHSFHKKFKEDLFLRKFILRVFDYRVSSGTLFLNNVSVSADKNLFEKNNIQIAPDTDLRSLSIYLFKLARLPFYLSSVRIIRYQQWLILYFYIVSPINKSRSSVRRYFNFFKYLIKCNSFIFKEKFDLYSF